MKKTVKFNDNEFEFTYKKDSVQVSIPIGQLKTTSNAALQLMQVKDDNLLVGSYQKTDDNIIWKYPITSNLKTMNELRNDIDIIDKLQLLNQMALLEKFEKSRINIFIHPDNLYFDNNYQVFVLHRGLEEMVPPLHINKEELLVQYKAFIFYTLNPKSDFEKLMYGNMKRLKSTKFNQQVKSAQCFEELKAILNQAMEQERDKRAQVDTIVPKKKYRFFRYGFYVELIAIILLGATLGYLEMVKIPFNNRLLASHQDFIAVDYDAVINDLKKDNPDKLPVAGQYVLATSYINVEGLSNTQKKNILKNISLKTDQNYLKYWIYNGRGDFKQALSVAKYIGDDQLILYTYTKLYEEANTNPQLTGDQKQSLLNSYQKKINSYKKKTGVDKNKLNK